MLSKKHLENSKQRQLILDSFEPSHTTWLVSDLKTKLNLQKKCLNKYSFIPEDSILRASEFWQKLFFRIYPEVSLLSEELSAQLISDWLSKSNYEWAKTSGAGKKMLEFMHQISGVLTHPEGQSQISEWLRSNESSLLSWGEWYIESVKIWHWLLTKKILPKSMVTAVLVNSKIESFLEKNIWKRNLIFDLGPDLNSFEAELALQISRKLNVDIIFPEVIGKYENLLLPYKFFELVKPMKVAENIPINLHQNTEGTGQNTAIEVKRFATMLSEVKDLTVQVREWIEQGVSPEKIAVSAPNIKSYIKIIDEYFQVEGIPLQIEKNNILSDIPDISRWLAELRLRTSELSTEDLEQTLYQSEVNTPAINFEKFYSLYAKIYGEGDLERSPEIARLIREKPFNRSGLLNKKEFFASAMLFWPLEADIGWIEKVAALIYKDGPESIELLPSDWVSYLQSILSRQDISIERIQFGVNAVGIDFLEDLDIDRVFLLGLSDDDLRVNINTKVEPAEIFNLQTQLGFLFPNFDPARLEFKLRWVLKDIRNIVYSFPVTDFNGNVLTPSMIWLEKALKLRKPDELTNINSPGLSRWDSIQRSHLDDIKLFRNWTEQHAIKLSERLMVDLGKEEKSVTNLPAIERLSASSIENYLDCPMIFAAKKLFRLQDLPELDLDVDGSTRGKIIHKIFEKLIQSTTLTRKAKEEIDHIVEVSAQEVGAQFGELKLWPQFKLRLISIAERFIEAELEWRQRFPQTHTVGKEVLLSGYIDSESGKLSRNQTQSSIKFIGFIDRIDQDFEKHAVLLDYKTSTSDITQFGSWLENNNLQLGIYALALEAGLSEYNIKEVVGASFYDVRTFDRKKGFRQLEGASHLLDLESRESNKITREKKEDFYRAVELKVKGVIEDLKSGNISAKPVKVKLCETCQWSKICRAPHLN